MHYAFGFLWAALRMRLHDVAAPLWMPVDWLLSTESGTHGSIALAVGAQVVYIQDGLQAAPGVRLRPPGVPGRASARVGGVPRARFLW
ncbi:hypothetical protein [Streptomyces mirabilis]|uniref:hypothetical protein n=1 Tax=Streptomyces mirabilis TaxID=68239 RepID=UPI0036D04038